MADEKPSSESTEGIKGVSNPRHPSQWSENEIARFMQENGINVPFTASTKTLILRKIARMCQLAEDKANDRKESSISESPVCENDIKTSRSARIGVKMDYYGVAIVNYDVQDETDAVEPISPFYEDKQDFSKLSEKYKGRLRFKKCDSKEEAEQFHFSLHGSKVQTTPSASSEKANDFKDPKQPELNDLKKCIESGDTENFHCRVMENPRYLISSGDAPRIITPGSYYNCVHVAVLSNRLAVCQEIFSIIDSDPFWEAVYPSDEEETRQMRKRHLVGLYLNRQTGRPPRKGQESQVQNCDTPLHIASKYGFEEVVEFLLSFSQTDTTIRDRDGKTPAEVICQRSGSAKTKSAIKTLFEEPRIYYVPVFRSEDNSTPPVLGSPCLWEESFSPSRAQSPVDPNCFNTATAGPMSPSLAKEFYKRWKRPKDSDTKEMLRKDFSKGMESVGRQLAQELNVGWREYWDFLGSRCSLASPEGLDLLEQHLTATSGCSHTPLCPGSTPPLWTTPHHLDAGASPTLLTRSKENSETKFRSKSDPDIEVGVRTRASTSEDDLDNLSSALKQSLRFDEEQSALGCDREQNKKREDSTSSPISMSLVDPSPTTGSDLATEMTEDIETGSDEGHMALDGAGVSPIPVSSSQLLYTPLQNREDMEQMVTFLTGSDPTRLDNEVLVAIGSDHVDLQRYPRVASWQNMVSSYSKKDRNAWQTPRSQGHSVTRRPHALSGTRIPLSPLVHSNSPHTPSSVTRKTSVPTTPAVPTIHPPPKRIL